MPPSEIFNSGNISLEDLERIISEYKKFDRKWSIRKLSILFFFGCSFLVSSGMILQKGKDWINGVDKDIKILYDCTGCNLSPKYDTHDKRQKFLNNINIKKDE